MLTSKNAVLKHCYYLATYMSWHCSSISFLRNSFFGYESWVFAFLLPLWETCVTNQSLCATEGPPLKLIMFFTDAYGKCHIRFCVFSQPCCAACGMLVTLQGNDLLTHHWKCSFNYWIARKVLKCISERVNERELWESRNYIFLYNEYTTTYLNFQAYFHHFIHFSITLLILPEDNF